MITDELREFSRGWRDRRCHAQLDAIADAIDSKHEECEGFARKLEDAANHRESVTLFGVDYIPCPLDADGKPIHIGDKLDGYNKTIEVVELRYVRSGWVLVSRDGNAYHCTAAFLHVQPDSWERIIRDARTINGCGSTEEFMECYGAELVKRCKKLAGEQQ